LLKIWFILFCTCFKKVFMDTLTPQIPVSHSESLMEQSFIQSEKQRTNRLVSALAKILMLAQSVGYPSYLVLFWISGEVMFLTGLPVVTLAIFGYFMAYLLNRRGLLIPAVWCMILSLFLMAVHLNWLFGTEAPGVLFFMLVVALSISLLNLRAVILMSGISLVFNFGIYLSEHIFKFYNPAVTMTEVVQTVAGLILISINIPVLALLLYYPVRSQIQAITAHATRLQTALSEIELRQRLGQQSSQQLLSLATQLNTTAAQQAATIEQQATSVREVTTGLEELSESATQIAVSAASAVESADHAVDRATEVRATSVLVESVVNQGYNAVAETIESVNRLRTRIELLGQRFLNLTAQAHQVSAIIDLIEEIADETHLLALNASIEAAGEPVKEEVGVVNSRGSSQSERFGVIALEVKNLADRSREATEEIRQSISEMQGALAAAVLVAEESKKETSATLTRSQVAGAAITRLSEAIFDSVNRAEQIMGAVEEVNTRCDEIRLATNQQRTANQQILVTMRSIMGISQQNAGVISQLSQMTHQVSHQMDALNQVLVQSNAPATDSVATSSEFEFD
jgi:methyl-accepting chemotaxis protein